MEQQSFFNPRTKLTITFQGNMNIATIFNAYMHIKTV